MKTRSLVLQKYASMQADNNVLMAGVAHSLSERKGRGEVERGRRGEKFGRSKYMGKEIRRPKGREAKAMDQVLALLIRHVGLVSSQCIGS